MILMLFLRLPMFVGLFLHFTFCFSGAFAHERKRFKYVGVLTSLEELRSGRQRGAMAYLTNTVYVQR